MRRYRLLKARKELGLPAPPCRECKWCVRSFAAPEPGDLVGNDRCSHPESTFIHCSFERKSGGCMGELFEPWRWAPKRCGLEIVLLILGLLNIMIGVMASVSVGGFFFLICIPLCTMTFLMFPFRVHKRIQIWFKRRGG